jgi:ribonuclease D
MHSADWTCSHKPRLAISAGRWQTALLMLQPAPSTAVSRQPNITHAELMALPILRYDGPIQLNAPLADFQRAIRHERVVGLDTETRPTFRKGQSHRPSVVQIAGSKAVYIFQLARLGAFDGLAELLANPHIVKTGIALDRDLTDLKTVFPFEAKNVLDLGTVAQRAGYGQTGVRNLTGLFMKGRITKGAQTSNWAQPRLTSRQLTYAATDAWVCRELYLQFESAGLLAK